MSQTHSFVFLYIRASYKALKVFRHPPLFRSDANINVFCNLCVYADIFRDDSAQKMRFEQKLCHCGQFYVNLFSAQIMSRNCTFPLFWWTQKDTLTFWFVQIRVVDTWKEQNPAPNERRSSAYSGPKMSVHDFIHTKSEVFQDIDDDDDENTNC